MVLELAISTYKLCRSHLLEDFSFPLFMCSVNRTEIILKMPLPSLSITQHKDTEAIANSLD